MIEIEPAEAYELQSRAVGIVAAYLRQDEEAAEVLIGGDAYPLLGVLLGFLTDLLVLELGREEVQARIDQWFRDRLAG